MNVIEANTECSNCGSLGSIHSAVNLFCPGQNKEKFAPVAWMTNKYRFRCEGCKAEALARKLPVGWVQYGVSRFKDAPTKLAAWCPKHPPAPRE